MGIFDFLKKKESSSTSLVIESNNICPQIMKNDAEKSLVPYIENLAIPQNVRNLLWFADGKFKNYNSGTESKAYENELFRLKYSFGTEPSLIYSQLPINQANKRNPKESIGYFPSYEKLDPEERRTYLEWLRDVTQTVDIGYVFIFYYGLERHLVFDKYKEAADMILLLRKYHKNNTFYSYSGSALIMASIIHKDKEMFLKVMKNIDTEYCNNIRLIAKYLLKEDLSIDEIISLGSSAGFTNKRYINGYPDLFKQEVSYLLKSGFGQDSLPFYNLKTNFTLDKEIIFANISFSEDTRVPFVPSIISNSEFKSLIYNLLSSAHESVKKELENQRKNGFKPESTTKLKDDIEKLENKAQIFCPYCETPLKDEPKKKKKCLTCGNYIYVRTKQHIFPSVLLKEEDAMAADGFEKLRVHGLTEKDFYKEKKKLSKEKNTTISSIDVCLSLYDKLLLQTTDLKLLQLFYFEMSLLVYNTSGDFLKYLQLSAQMELMACKQRGFDKVSILTSGDASCLECNKLSGKVYKIDEALRENPIPCKTCSFKLFNGKQGWCRCLYTPYLE